jgi:hypothetical protein
MKRRSNPEKVRCTLHYGNAEKNNRFTPPGGPETATPATGHRARLHGDFFIPGGEILPERRFLPRNRRSFLGENRSSTEGFRAGGAGDQPSD